MTSPDDVPLDGPRDGSTDDPSKGTPEGPAGPGADGPWSGPAFDEDAAWRLIVENYGEPVLGSTALDPAPAAEPPAQPVEPTPPSYDDAAPPARAAEDHDLFDRSYLDAGGADAEPHDRRRTDHEHFVPPEPPPVPKATPARRLAWSGLFAPPVLMILAVVFGLSFPSWLAMLLVAGFIGGFVFLVLTMPRDGDDGRGDGAVV